MLTLIILSVVLVAGYFYCVKNYDYWKKRGVPYVQPVVIFGCTIDPFLQRRSMTELFVEWYKKYPDEKVVGLFEGTKPCLLIRDPELVKRVLITDFVSFHERGLHPDQEGIEPLLSNLFFVEGDLWRSLRQRMTPAFTSGKLKAMFPLIVERAEKLQTRALNAARQGKVIDARDLMARYTTDFIGACGFGLDADSLNEENSDFRKLGKEIFRFGFMHGVKSVLKDLFPRFFRSVKFFGNIENQVLSLVYNIQKQRNFQPSNRHDFIDLLMECQRKGPIEIESLVKVKADGTPSRTIIEMTDQLLAAQVFIFFAAGFETSSSSTSYTLHQLAYNPEVLKKVQKEIDKVLSKHDNKLSFEAVKEMTYLEWTFREGMRMFPSLGYLSRMCTQKYTFPELDLTIDKVGIIIPLQALHMDPQYFENPEEFRPERFDPENEKESNKYVYLPFGQGPRACIGERLGLMQSLAGLAAVLSKFDVTPAPESKRVLDVKPQYDIVQNIAG
ncbi:cytochrome P450 6B6-like [Ostrinia nubilalis]|uniref:cytochrome P450 6B6-like n=1 Tax=Ostrinia nubilalis TaxID=29057 RepID=UPI0030822934